MHDINYLKQYYSACDTEALIQNILFKMDDFEPEASEVIKKEYQKRAGDIEELIASENVKSGTIECKIPDAQYYDFQKQGYVKGHLIFTTKNVVFLPSYIIKDSPLLFGAFAYTFGTLGVIGDEVFRHLTTKGEKIENKELPVTLIARYMDYSFSFKTTEIKSIRIWKSGEIGIELFLGKSIGILCDKNVILQVQSWGSQHNIHLYQSSGFLNSIMEKISSIFKK